MLRRPMRALHALQWPALRALHCPSVHAAAHQTPASCLPCLSAPLPFPPFTQDAIPHALVQHPFSCPCPACAPLQSMVHSLLLRAEAGEPAAVQLRLQLLRLAAALVVESCETGGEGGLVGYTIEMQQQGSGIMGATNRQAGLLKWGWDGELLHCRWAWLRCFPACVPLLPARPAPVVSSHPLSPHSAPIPSLCQNPSTIESSCAFAFCRCGGGCSAAPGPAGDSQVSSGSLLSSHASACTSPWQLAGPAAAPILAQGHCMLSLACPMRSFALPWKNFLFPTRSLAHLHPATPGLPTHLRALLPTQQGRALFQAAPPPPHQRACQRSRGPRH